MKPTLLWFRQDLRLADNSALAAARDRGGPIVPVFIWAPEEEGNWPPGAASRWWLHQSLTALSGDLEAVGSGLVIRAGPTRETLFQLCKDTGADAVFWNRRYEPAAMARDQKIRESLQSAGFEAESFNAALLHEPWTVQNKAGKPFRVFTAFWRHCLTLEEPAAPSLAPARMARPPKWPKTIPLAQLGLEPKVNWADGLHTAWQPGASGALRQLGHFLDAAFDRYAEQRNRPDQDGTSRLSPHLHFGEISPRQIWDGLRRIATKRGLPSRLWRHSQFLAEVGWREFSHHLLFHFPFTVHEPLRPEFTKFPWRRDPKRQRAWQKGVTGYPLVDAGMRELWQTGWMHNRVRMVVASFLVKDLLISWREGAAWFWDTLVDADLAQNTLGWQWTAGCGADAAPYFRVFNPTGQAEKFDPRGLYVAKWCPELAKLPADWIHRPAQAPPEILARAGIQLGSSYPEPLVNHTIAREIALDAYARQRIKVPRHQRASVEEGGGLSTR